MSDEHKFYGMYRGKVLNNTDPESLGRIQVEIYPMLIGTETARLMKKENPNSFVEGIATDQLPWAVPAMPIFGGSGDGTGFFAVPDENSKIWCFFEGGDVNQPVYCFEAPDVIYGIKGTTKQKIIALSSGITITLDDNTGQITITGEADVIVQGANVRINPP